MSFALSVTSRHCLFDFCIPSHTVLHPDRFVSMPTLTPVQNLRARVRACICGHAQLFAFYI